MTWPKSVPGKVGRLAACLLLAAAQVAAPARTARGEPAPDPVISVTVAGTARAYPLAAFAENPVLNDQLGPMAVVLYLDQASGAAAAYFRLVGGEPIEFSGQARNGVADDLTTASRWDMLTGRAVGGGLEGQSLTPIPFRRWGREEWRKANPKGSLFGE